MVGLGADLFEQMDRPLVDAGVGTPVVVFRLTIRGEFRNQKISFDR